MKNLLQIVTYRSETLDGRDMIRLVTFIPENMMPALGVALTPEFIGKHEAEPLTRENVLNHLKDDLEFAFEKALDKRGLSAGSMHAVISMWNWILEEGLEDFPEDNYAQYGLPLFKATALKYGFPNPIGDDTGTESKYSSEGEDRI